MPPIPLVGWLLFKQNKLNEILQNANLMLRKITIYAIAAGFIFSGVWGLIYFILSLFFDDANNLQISIPVSVPFLLYAGFHLFQRKDSGRKLALILLSIQVVILLGLLAWVLLQKGDTFQFRINFWEEKYVVAEDRITFVVMMLTWSLTLVLIMAFLLQKKTKELFSSRDNSITSESKVMP